MRVDYKSVIITGVTAGIIIGLLANLLLCTWPIIIVIESIAGLVVAMMANAKLRLSDRVDSIVTGAFAGGLAGMIGGVLYTLKVMLFMIYIDQKLGSIRNNSSIMDVIANNMDFIFTWPCLFSVSGILFGIMGGLAYYYFIKRKSIIK